jgi:hypothetical protein
MSESLLAHTVQEFYHFLILGTHVNITLLSETMWYQFPATDSQ